VHVTPEGLEEVEIGPSQLAAQEQRLQEALKQLVEVELSQERPSAPSAAPCADCPYTDWCPEVDTNEQEASQ